MRYERQTNRTFLGSWNYLKLFKKTCLVPVKGKDLECKREKHNFNNESLIEIQNWHKKKLKQKKLQLLLTSEYRISSVWKSRSRTFEWTVFRTISTSAYQNQQQKDEVVLNLNCSIGIWSNERQFVASAYYTQLTGTKISEVKVIELPRLRQKRRYKRQLARLDLQEHQPFPVISHSDTASSEPERELCANSLSLSLGARGRNSSFLSFSLSPVSRNFRVHEFTCVSKSQSSS